LKNILNFSCGTIRVQGNQTTNDIQQIRKALHSKNVHKINSYMKKIKLTNGLQYIKIHSILDE
jgi:hypothetical protein